MKKMGITFLIFSCLLMQIGCASIISGKHQEVSVKSDPLGAKVEVDGSFVGITPVIAKLKRNESHKLEIVKEGYLEETRLTKQGFNWWLIGSAVLTGLVGIIIDYATGSAYTVEPKEVHVNLLQKKTQPSFASNVDKLENDESEKAAMDQALFEQRS